MDEHIETKQATSLRDFLNVLFRRKWVIVSTVGIATFLVFFLNERRPETWESNSRVLVRRGEQGSILSGNIRYLGWAEEMASEVEVILSEDVFKRAGAMFADSVKAKNLPAEWTFNSGSVRADVLGESNAFVIRYVDTRRDICPIGCEAVTLAFQEYYRERKAPPELSDFFANEIEDVRRELEESRNRRNEFMSQEKFFGAQETTRFLLNKASSLEDRLSKLNGDISSQTLRVSNLEALAKKTGPELESELAFSVSQHVLQMGIVQDIKHSLQTLNLRKQELTQKYTDQHPEVVAVDEQIRGLHDDLKREVENAYHVEKVSLEEMQLRRASVLGELNEVRAELDALPDREREMAELDATILKLEEKHKLFLDRQSESQIAQASYLEWDVTILSHASTPYSKKTRDYVRLALGPFLSLIVGLGIAFFLESIDHSVKTTAEAEEYLDVPVLAIISEYAPDRRRAAGSG